MTWLASVSGRAVDLVSPAPEQVDFTELAWALAHVNRWCGNGQTVVSVAFHTLIGLDLCPERLRPLWLVYNAAAGRLGDTPPAVALSLAEVAEAEIDPGAGKIVTAALQILRQRHDLVIHAAAGLRMPTITQRAELSRLDRQVAGIEVDTFHRAAERPVFTDDVPPPLRRPSRRFQPADKTADQLAARFRDYLPALRALDAA